MGALVGKAEMRPRVGVVRCCRLAMNQIWPQWYPIFFGKDSDFNSTPWVKYAPLQRGSHETGALAAEAAPAEALAAGAQARQECVRMLALSACEVGRFANGNRPREQFGA